MNSDTIDDHVCYGGYPLRFFPAIGSSDVFSWLAGLLVTQLVSGRVHDSTAFDTCGGVRRYYLGKQFPERSAAMGASAAVWTPTYGMNIERE